MNPIFRLQMNLILRQGSAWYQGLGTDDHAGTKVISLSGDIQRPGNYEVPIGFSLNTLLHEWAGGPPPGRQIQAATMAGFNAIVVECQASKIEFRIRSGYLNTQADTLEHALAMIDEANIKGKPISIGILGNVVDVLEEMQQKDMTPDVLTDQTSAHDPVNGYLPQGWNVEQWVTEQQRDPKYVSNTAKKTR